MVVAMMMMVDDPDAETDLKHKDEKSISEHKLFPTAAVHGSLDIKGFNKLDVALDFKQLPSDAGKMALCLRLTLDELGHHATGTATCIFEDNKACCVCMANATAKNTRHMETKFFSLQEWVERDLVVLEHVPAALSPQPS